MSGKATCPIAERLMIKGLAKMLAGKFSVIEFNVGSIPGQNLAGGGGEDQAVARLKAFPPRLLHSFFGCESRKTQDAIGCGQFVGDVTQSVFNSAAIFENGLPKCADTHAQT